LKCEGPWERERGEAKPFPLPFVLCALLSLKKERHLGTQGYSVYLLQKNEKSNKLENCKEKSLPSSNSVFTKNLVKTNGISNKIKERNHCKAAQAVHRSSIPTVCMWLSRTLM